MELTEDEVLQILKLIDESSFDFFQLEAGELKITVSKGDYLPASAQPAASPQTRPAPVARAVEESAIKAPEAKTEPTNRVKEDGLLPVTAPLLGTFYVAPEPGAPPFVQLGAAVDEETTVGLIEVMKVFNSVRAGVSGTVAEILVQNGQFVEYGQKLFLIKPAGASGEAGSSG